MATHLHSLCASPWDGAAHHCFLTGSAALDTTTSGLPRTTPYPPRLHCCCCRAPGVISCLHLTACAGGRRQLSNLTRAITTPSPAPPQRRRVRMAPRRLSNRCARSRLACSGSDAGGWNYGWSSGLASATGQHTIGPDDGRRAILYDADNRRIFLRGRPLPDYLPLPRHSSANAPRLPCARTRLRASARETAARIGAT